MKIVCCTDIVAASKRKGHFTCLPAKLHVLFPTVIAVCGTFKNEISLQSKNNLQFRFVSNDSLLVPISNDLLVTWASMVHMQLCKVAWF